jgi:hypothetical protein
MAESAPTPAFRATTAHRLIGSPARQAAALIAIFVVLRLIADHFIGLGVDEAYTVGASRDLRLSYFDHPPLHYWLTHLIQQVAGGGRADRLPFIALFAGTSWLMFVLTRRLFGERAGLWAVAALNLSGFFTLAAGGWVLPDGPLLFALLGAASALARGWFPRAGEAPASGRAWLTAGVWLGLAALSKYQAALFCLGLGLFTLTARRARADLARPAPYAAAAITLVLLSPVVIWNSQHHWASFAFQGGRGAPRAFQPLGPLIALAGQAALLLPWIFAPLAVGAVRAARAGPADERRWFCLMLAAPAIVLFTLTPMLGAKALPHWSMPGWILLFPLLGQQLASAAEAGRAWPRRWAIASAAFLIVVGAAATEEDATGWMGQAFPAAFKRGDPTAESVEWSQLRPALAARGLLGPGRPLIVALKWNEAGKIDQALGETAEVTVFSNDPRQFAFRGDRSRWIGRDAVILGRPDTVKAHLVELGAYFQSLSPAPPIYVGREGRREIEIAVVVGHGLKRAYPLPF